jgi:integrase/recombinase XerD
MIDQPIQEYISPLSTNLVLADQTPAEQNPATIYLASLAEGSRRTMREALNTIATLLSVDETRNAAGQDVRCLTTPWGQLRYAHTVAIRSALAEKYAPATANKLLAALRRVLKEAFRLGQISAEEYQRAILVPTVRGKREPKGRMITDSEIRALMQVCSVDPSPMGARDAAIIAVLRGTGLRRSEVAALDVADYEPQTEAIVVRAGKGNKDRRVYAPSGTVAALDAWLEVRGQRAGALFGRAVRGGRVGERRLADEGVAVILRDRAAAAGVAPFTPHDMRRTYISELLDAGADLATVQKMVGHESVTTTAGYDRRGDAAKRKAADLVHVPFFPRQA